MKSLTRYLVLFTILSAFGAATALADGVGQLAADKFACGAGADRGVKTVRKVDRLPDSCDEGDVVEIDGKQKVCGSDKKTWSDVVR